MSEDCCREYEQILILTAAGVAAPAETTRLLSHIEGCSACRQEFERLDLMISAMEKSAKLSMASAPPQNLHALLMSRLRSEAVGPQQSTGALSWAETFRSRFTSWKWAWSAIVIVGMLTTTSGLVHWLAKKRGSLETERAAVVSSTVVSQVHVDAQPARPVELRHALVRSFDDFENILRRNDHVLAMRDPIAVPVRSLPAMEY
jgi:anti-sigma factor RsiW